MAKGKKMEEILRSEWGIFLSFLVAQRLFGLVLVA